MGAFVSSIRRVDPQATGVPITQYESMNDMARAFTIMAVGAILVVALVVWLDFRSIVSTLLCMGSLAVGILWTLGLLALFSIPLNLANFFAIPILIGLGTDSSIHVLHRWRDMQRNGESRYGRHAARSDPDCSDHRDRFRCTADCTTQGTPESWVGDGHRQHRLPLVGCRFAATGPECHSTTTEGSGTSVNTHGHECEIT